ncbi:MAG: autotransporter outer membrane beta-barrel domain-containing protein [Ancalomicrobiaceae bacterium]|nr:autotransporter outer membrane beta-barrel domain-containing protein [Ancalomicrobiaceae bacterium]
MAADTTWSGITDGNFATTTNWDSGLTSASDAIINGNGANAPVAAAGTVNINSLALQSGTLTLGPGSTVAVGTTFVMSGGTLTGSGTITDLTASISGATIDSSVTISSSLGTTLDGTLGNVTINGVISGSGGVLKSNGNTFTLTSTNSYGSGTTVTSGTLALSGAGTLGATTNSTTVNGGTLDLGGTIQIQAGITLSSGTLTNGTLNATAVTATGGTVSDLAGSMTLAVTGGTVTAAGANTYSGTTTVSNAGTLQAGSTTGLSTASAVTLQNSAILDLNGFSNTILSLASASATTKVESNTGAATLTLGDANNQTFAGQFLNGSGTLGLTKQGAGILTLTGTSNTYSGATTINAGTLKAGVDNALSSLSATTISGGTLDLGTHTESVTAGITLSSGTLTNGTLNATAVTATGGTVSDLAGTMTLAVTGGTVTAAGTNTYSGTTTVSNAGTLQAGSTTGLSTASAVTLQNSAILDLNGFSNTILSLASASATTKVESNTGAATLTLGDANNQTFAGQILNGSGTLGLTKQGAGTLTLTGTSTFNTVRINTGTVLVDTGGSVTLSTGLGSMYVASGATLINHGSITDTLDNFGTVTNTSTYTADATNETSGVINNSGTWTGSILNNGQLNLSGTNSISGTVTNNGQVNLAAGTTATVGDLANSSTIRLGDGTQAALTNTLTVNGTYTATGSSHLVVDANLTAGATGTRAEELIATAASTGATSITINKVQLPANGVLASPITIADVATGANFTLANAAALQNGPVTYTLDAVTSGGRTQWELTSHLNGVGAVAASVGSAISAISTGFAEPTSAFVTGPSDPRQDQVSIGVWARTKAGQYDVGSITTANADIKAAKMRSQFEGVQAGIDGSISDIGGSNWSVNFGVTAGDVKVFSHDLLSSATSKVNIDAPFFGLYAVAKGDGFYADVQAQRNYYNLDLTNAFIAASGTTLKGQGYSVVASAGKVFPLFEAWTLEPSLGFNYSSVTIGQLATLAGTLKSDTVDSYIGSARLKLGTSFKAGDKLVLAPSVQASVWHEFAGDATSTFVTPGTTTPISTTRIGTFGQLGVGVFGQILDSGASGFIRADYRAGENVHGGSITAGLRYQF